MGQRFSGDVNNRDEHIRPRVEPHRGEAWEPRYAGFFDCFNGGRYFEAHEVLEGLWLAKRRHADGRFYQGLIQLAGAFVHVQQRRARPALSLLRRAQEHLSAYAPRHHGLAVDDVLGLIAQWQERIQADPGGGIGGDAPRLELGASR